MVKKFSCTNFRNIELQEMEFGKINILIGPNNAGKTNFIRALSFLANMSSIKDKTGLNSSFLGEMSRNGWSRTLNKYADSSIISLKWDIVLDSDTVTYELDFHVGDEQDDFYIVKESLANAVIPHHEARPFNYFECHTAESGKGWFSVANKGGQSNNRIPAKISNRDSVIFQIKDAFLNNPELYENSELRKKAIDIVEKLNTYFKRFCAYSSSQFDLSEMKRPAEIKSSGLYLEKRSAPPAHHMPMKFSLSAKDADYSGVTGSLNIGVLL